MIYTFISLETHKDFTYTLNNVKIVKLQIIKISKEIIMFFVPFWSGSYAVFGRDFNHNHYKKLNISEFILMFIEENKGIT